MATVQALSARGVRFLVPLAVGARLAAWGVPDSLVTELDWWDSARVGNLTHAVLAHRLVRGRVMLPVHWAGFDLA
jgi:L-ascorbate metabolism protein UlaG (beta-lactamase superfamily)